MVEARTRILLVGAPEGKPLRSVLEQLLGRQFQLDVVDGPDAAISRLGKGDVGAVLFDMSRSEQTQWTAFRRIESQVPDVPVLVMTSHEDDAVSMRALRDGAQDHLVLSRLDPPGLVRALVFAMERHRMVRERQAALERLRELERFKTQFINTAAHELNSPLTPVKLQLHLIRTTNTENLTVKQKNSLDIMERNVDRLIGLVTDVLEAARLQASRLLVKKQSIDLAKIIAEAVESTQAQARAQAVELVLESKPGLRVDADPDRISQVCYNLLGNALKFTPKGGKVSVTCGREGGFAVVRVTDTGIGLRPEDFLKLFQPFSQTHDWTNYKMPGSGLGLYISQGIVEQHGGRIWCDSPGPNRGSTFSFAIPLPKPPVEAPKTAMAPAKPEAKIVKAKAVWSIIYFKCPVCASRDINMRILRNKYECRACQSEWT